MHREAVLPGRNRRPAREIRGRALIEKADIAFLAQPAPTPPATNPAAGLLHIDGVRAGEEVTGSLDALVDLVAQLQANGGQPTHILTDPIGWGQLRKLKTATDSNQSLLGAGTTDATPMLLSLPLPDGRDRLHAVGAVRAREAHA